MKEKRPDHEIIQGVLKGDTDAYSTLVERYRTPLYNLMIRMVRSREDAAELCQDSFIKAYGQLHRFDLDRSFYPWLYTIGMNTAKNFLRKKRPVPIEDHMADQSAMAEWNQGRESLDNSIARHEIFENLLKLDLLYREALILRYRDDLAVRDISRALQISESGVKMRIKRGLEKLRKVIRADGRPETSRGSLTQLGDS